MIESDLPRTRPVDTYPCCRICQQNARTTVEDAVPAGTEHAEHASHRDHDQQESVEHAERGGHEHHESTHAHQPEVGMPGEVEHDRHDAHTDHSGHEVMFQGRFWVCLVLSIPGDLRG